MNQQQHQFIYDTLSHVFPLAGLNLSDLSIATHADLCADNLFTLHLSQPGIPKNLALQVRVAPDWTVSVRIAVAGDTHAFNGFGAPLLMAEELFRGLVGNEDVAAGHWIYRARETWDPMDLSEDEMHWNDAMEIDY
ncbi:hypothetical protein G7Z17_g3104 [Cylindrodendrum hubeiense]|uniref:Uncharacterized protein n=1 Tax=Cylindrodendrum hubeiense TaxID=595255 RepID=A0A9P5LIG5_9HYPO|nr:hypothetical protein G7Z17_g3104 [Cylindrodendrum hubeiense]